MMRTGEVIDLLKDAQGERSLRQFAKELDVSASYLSDLYLNRRSPGPKVLGYLGLQKKRTIEIEYFKDKRPK